MIEGAILQQDIGGWVGEGGKTSSQENRPADGGKRSLVACQNLLPIIHRHIHSRLTTVSLEGGRIIFSVQVIAFDKYHYHYH